MKNLSVFLYFVGIIYSQIESDYKLYIKSTPSYYEGQAKRFDVNSQMRLNHKLYYSDFITITSELKLSHSIGETVKYTPNYVTVLQRADDQFNFNKTLYTSENQLLFSRLDRLYMELYIADFQLTLGRQRIAWGTSLVWNPIDIFHSSSPLDFDNEEKNGADAIRFQYYYNATGSIEIVHKFSKQNAFDTKDRNEITALKWTSNYFDYDVHLLTAVKGGTKLIGLAFAGDIYGGGFRAEYVYYDSDLEYYPTSPFSEILLTKENYSVFSISADYSLESSLYFHSEFLYNGNGHDETDVSSQIRQGILNELSTSRYSIYLESSYQVSPLIKTGIFTVLNPIDHSQIYLSSTDYNYSENLDLSLFLIFSFGETNSEWKKQKGIFFRSKYSF